MRTTGIHATMKAAMERSRQAVEKQAAQRKMPKRKALRIDTDRVQTLDDHATFTGDPVHDLNQLATATLKAVAVEKAKRKPRANLASNAASEHRSYDASFYCVLIFDDAGQNHAFVDAVKAKAHIDGDGNIFLDGRRVADGLGIVLPEPAYQLKNPEHIRVKAASTKKASHL